MKKYEYKWFSKRNLPHMHPPGATLFVTFRLHGSVPQPVLRFWRAKKRFLDEELRRLQKQGLPEDSPDVLKHRQVLVEFKRSQFRECEELLHAEKTGPLWLKDERIAKLVCDGLHWRDEKVYRLDAYCVMSNHVHTVFKPFLDEDTIGIIQTEGRQLYESSEPPLDVIMQSLKGYTAYKANRLLNRQGEFWARESFDHVIRSEAEYRRTIKYVLNNPVKAGLVDDWRDWRWSWKRDSEEID